MGIILSEISNRKDQIKEYIHFQKIAEPAFGDFFIFETSPCEVSYLPDIFYQYLQIQNPSRISASNPEQKSLLRFDAIGFL